MCEPTFDLYRRSLQPVLVDISRTTDLLRCLAFQPGVHFPPSHHLVRRYVPALAEETVQVKSEPPLVKTDSQLLPKSQFKRRPLTQLHAHKKSNQEVFKPFPPSPPRQVAYKVRVSIGAMRREAVAVRLLRQLVHRPSAASAPPQLKILRF